MSQQPPQRESRRGNMATIITIVVVVAVLLIYFLNTSALSWLVPTLVATPEAGVAAPPAAEGAAASDAGPVSGGVIASDAETTAVAAGSAAAAADATAVELPTTVAGQGDTQADQQADQQADAQATEVPAEINGVPTILFADLPVEAHETIALIDASGPFPYEQDDAVFENREGLLPSRPRGYYREYTVVTPGEDDRGARRVVGGAEGELYYTDDHYDSFTYVVR
jgi:ribonuclease T1